MEGEHYKHMIAHQTKLSLQTYLIFRNIYEERNATPTLVPKIFLYPPSFPIGGSLGESKP